MLKTTVKTRYTVRINIFTDPCRLFIKYIGKATINTKKIIRSMEIETNPKSMLYVAKGKAIHIAKNHFSYGEYLFNN